MVLITDLIAFIVRPLILLSLAWRALDEAMHQLQRLDIEDKLMWRTKRQFQHDIQSMFSLVDNIIAERKSSGDQEENDLLSVC